MLSINHYPLSIIHYPLSIIHYPLSIIQTVQDGFQMLQTPNTAIKFLPTAGRYTKRSSMNTFYINRIEAIFGVTVLTIHFDITIVGNYI